MEFDDSDDMKHVVSIFIFSDFAKVKF